MTVGEMARQLAFALQNRRTDVDRWQIAGDDAFVVRLAGGQVFHVTVREVRQELSD